LACRVIEVGEERYIRRVGAGLDVPGDLEPGAEGGSLGAVVAVTGEDVCARVGGVADEVISEGGLADAGLTADEDEGAATGVSGRQAVMQDGTFAVTPDEGR
jgi:hypothetical protein